MPLPTFSTRSLRALKIGLAVLFVLEVPACMTRDARPVQYAELRHRVAFDFQCNESDITVTPLQEISGASCTTEFHGAKTAGVTCHERRATYVLAQTDRSGNQQWILNTDERPAK